MCRVRSCAASCNISAMTAAVPKISLSSRPDFSRSSRKRDANPANISGVQPDSPGSSGARIGSIQGSNAAEGASPGSVRGAERCSCRYQAKASAPITSKPSTHSQATWLLSASAPRRSGSAVACLNDEPPRRRRRRAEPPASAPTSGTLRERRRIPVGLFCGTEPGSSKIMQ